MKVLKNKILIIILITVVLGVTLLFYNLRSTNILNRSVINEADLNQSFKQYYDEYELNKLPNNIREILILAKSPNFYKCKFNIFHTTYYLLERTFTDRSSLCINSRSIENSVIRMHSDKKQSTLTYFYYDSALSVNYNKDMLLQFYINNIKFEDGIYGLPMASYYYFDKPLEELTTEEAIELVLNIDNGKRNSASSREERKDFILQNIK